MSTHGSFVAPPDDLLDHATPSIEWELPVGIQALAVSSQLVAWDTGGGIRGGWVGSGEVFHIGPGGVDGAGSSWFSPSVVGDAILAWENRGVWAHQAGQTARLVASGGNKTIIGYGSDGATLVWVEGLDKVLQDYGAVFSQVTLFKAPFTTNPNALAPEVVANLPLNSHGVFHTLPVANGYTVVPWGATGMLPVQGARLVRLSDGKQWEVLPPAGQSWQYHFYPSATDVWLTTGRNPGVIVTDITKVRIADLPEVP